MKFEKGDKNFEYELPAIIGKLTFLRLSMLDDISSFSESYYLGLRTFIEEIAEEYSGKAKICKLDTEEARDSAMEFDIRAIPTIILFKDGQVQKKWVGLTSKKDLTEAIDELL